MKSFLFKNLYRAVILTAMVVLCLFVFAGCGKDKVENKVISEGVTVSGINLGGFTKEEAKKVLSSHAKVINDIALEFECEGIEFAVPAAQIELKFNVDESVEKAYAVGRGKESKKDKKSTKKEGYNFNMPLSYNKDKLVLATSEVVGDKLIDPSPMKVEFGSDCLIVTNAVTGTVVDFDKFTIDLEKEFADFKQDNKLLLNLKEHTPDNLTFEQFKADYVKEAKDAVYTEVDGKHHIEPEVIGVEIDEAEAKKIFEANQENNESYKISAKITQPAVTASQLEERYINLVISKYSTSFAGSSKGRCDNIALAASKINGYVVNPGERFSYNDVVGPRTLATGFKIAHVYVGTKEVDGIGGGICQVSSTLYNAVVLADLKTVSRTNHSIPVHYVPMGRDATVSYGTIDYVFENDTSYPISIKATIEGTTLTIAIVGTSEMDYTVEFQSGYVSSVPFSETKIEVDTLPEGKTKIITRGSNGSIYKSSRVYKRNGVEFDRKFEAKSTYLPTNQEVAVGVPKKEEPDEKTTKSSEVPVAPKIQETPVTPEIPEVSEPPAVSETPDAVEIPQEPAPVEEELPPVSEDIPVGGNIEDIIVHPEETPVAQEE